MGGCSNCNQKSGCDHRKGEMFAALDQTLAALYPTRTWGQLDDEARFAAGAITGVDQADVEALAEEIAAELDAATFVRTGDDGEYCDYIYVLCLGREPCLVQIRDGEVPVPEEVADAHANSRASPHTGPQPVIREQYLRVCLSHMTRMAAVQQSEMVLETVPGGGYLVGERPRAGVYDAPLLRRFQRLVALLPAYDILHLDFGDISQPPEGYLPGDYTAHYGGGAPSTANYLFYPQPSTMRVTCFVPPPSP